MRAGWGEGEGGVGGTLDGLVVERRGYGEDETGRRSAGGEKLNE